MTSPTTRAMAISYISPAGNVSNTLYKWKKTQPYKALNSTSTGWMLNTNREQSASNPHWEKKYLSTQFKQYINLRELPSADRPFPHLHCLKNIPSEYLQYVVVFPSAVARDLSFSAFFYVFPRYFQRI